MVENKNREYFQKLANQLMFNLSNEEADELVSEFGTLEQQFALMEEINTDGVEEMIYPFEEPITYIRHDEADHVISQDDAMRKVTKKLEGHFVLPKVVK